MMMTQNTLAIAVAVFHLLVTPCLAFPPKRVVSMNVCTDQMAMLLAEPGQLLSVSFLASDPYTSALADHAKQYVVNHGSAEEVYMLKPDLVLSGSYTTRTTVGLLRELGVTVEEFSHSTSFDDVRAEFRQMGDVLGRRERAEAIIAEFDAELAKLTSRQVPDLRVALYYANSYSSGAGTLVDEVVRAAGLRNVSNEYGLSGTGVLPLEALLMADPDIIVVADEHYDAPALAQQNFKHPAFLDLVARKRTAKLPPALTVCGGPFTLEAVRLLQDAAEGAGHHD